MTEASVALLGRTGTFAQCRVQLPAAAKDDAAFVADGRYQDIHGLAQPPSTASCSTGMSPTSQLLACQVDGEERCQLATQSLEVSKVSSARGRSASSFDMPIAPWPTSESAAAALNSSAEDGSESECDETEEQYSPRLSFVRVRTNSVVGMPVSPEASAMLASMAKPQTEKSDSVDTVQLKLSALIGSDDGTKDVGLVGDAGEDGCHANMMSRPRPRSLTALTAASGTSEMSFEPMSMAAATAPCTPVRPGFMMMPPAQMVPPSMMLPTSMSSSAMGPLSSSPQMMGTPIPSQLAVSQQGDRNSSAERLCNPQVSPSQPVHQRRKRTDDAAVPENLPTTICFRNLPNNYSTKMVLELLDQSGFKNSYDFVYLPHDFKRLPSLVNIGYFFVNFVSHDVAASALEQLTGFKHWTLLSSKVLVGSWAARTQGRTACIERCKYFTFMHDDIPNECKPMVFENGVPQFVEQVPHNRSGRYQRNSM